MGALYPVAAKGLPTLADMGYQGAGIGVHVPFKGSRLGADNRPYVKGAPSTDAIGVHGSINSC